MDWILIAATIDKDPYHISYMLNLAWVIFSVGAGLGFVIFVHELGHFLVAKACGVKCEKFYVGFDWFPIKRIGRFTIPTSICKFQWGETEYGIGILPLGGYVKMLGQDDDPRNAQAEMERTKVLKEGTAAEGLSPGETVEGKQTEFVLDPRSYPAKSVPARMAIISAGVIMNLIFGVILAAVAYYLGVTELPAVVGVTVPGDPAWVAGLSPGDKMIQVGRNGKRSEHLRFLDDFTKPVVFNGSKQDLPFLVRHKNGKEEWYELRPSERLKRISKRPTIGIHSATTQVLTASEEEELSFLEPVTSLKIAKGDKVVAVNGQKIESGDELLAFLAQHPTGDLTLQVERQLPAEKDGSSAEVSKTEVLEIVVAPRKMRDLGLSIKPGPVAAVRKGSPAASAGIEAGDVIESIDGEPVGDLLSLGQRLLPKIGEQVAIRVSRKDSSGKPMIKDFTVVPQQPVQFPVHNLSVGGPVGIEPLGVAIALTSEVGDVDGEGPAAGKLQAGDKITKVEFVRTDEGKLKEDKSGGLKAKTSFELDDLVDWTCVSVRVDSSFPTTKVKVTFSRQGKEMTATLQPQESKSRYDESRNLGFESLQDTHTASGPVEAFQLGLREVKERLTEVVTVLAQLVTGDIALSNLSGPPGVIKAASDQASRGIPSLLMFLAFLSANLAIINFLPIPVLDGGHMLFLAAEGIRRKPVPVEVQGWLSLAGLAFLLCLMVFATAMDVTRWFQ